MQAALKINTGDTLRYVVSGGEVRIPKARSVAGLSGMLKRPSQSTVTVKAMYEVIAEGATSYSCRLLSLQMSSCVFDTG